MMIDWADYANFTADEMRCKGTDCCGGRADMDPDFMAALQRVRDTLGEPMPITSGFRCLEYDSAIGGAGVHPTGQAADIAISGESAYHLLNAAMLHGMRGIGQKQHGPYEDRFMHLDITTGPLRPRIWSYPN